MRNFYLSALFLFSSLLAFGQCQKPEVTWWHFYNDTSCVLQFNNPSGAPHVFLRTRSNMDYDNIPNFSLENTQLIPSNPGMNIDTVYINRFSNDTVSYVAHGIYYGFTLYWGSLSTICASGDTSESFDFTFSPHSIENTTGPVCNIEMDHPPVFLPDGQGVSETDSIYVSGVPGELVSDSLTLTIEIGHTFDGDLSISLESPSGTVVELLPNNQAFGAHHNLSIILNDAFEPLQPSTAGSYYIQGLYQPDNPLSAFAGEPLQGYWKLKVQDNWPIDNGDIYTWCLSNGFPSALNDVLSGTVYADVNNNGSLDNSSDMELPYSIVSNSGDPISHPANNNGVYFNYNIPEIGQLTVTNVLPYLSQVPNPTPYNLNNSSHQNIRMVYNTNGADLSVVITSIQNFSTHLLYYFIHCKNAGNQCTSASISLNFNSDLTFNSTTLPNENIADTTLTSSLGNMCPGDVADYQVTFHINPLSNGNTLTAVANATISGDSEIYPDNNSDSDVNLIYTPYDPNYIAVDRDSVLPDFITSQHYLNYTIHFQNIGSGSANYVAITQYIDPATLDEYTMQFLNASSDSLTIQTSNTGEVRYIFNNINLASANTDSLQSQGFVKVAFIPKNNLIVGDQIKTSASIVFNSNDSVPTDTANTVIYQSSGLHMVRADYAMKLYPNPANNKVIIAVPQSMIGGKLEITNVEGKLMKTATVADIRTVLDLTDLANGFYIVRFEKQDIYAIQKLIKE